MGGLRKFVDKIKPTFSEGGKLSFLGIDFRCVRNVPFRAEYDHEQRSPYPRLQRYEAYDDRGGRGADAGLVVRYV